MVLAESQEWSAARAVPTVEPGEWPAAGRGCCNGGTPAVLATMCIASMTATRKPWRGVAAELEQSDSNRDGYDRSHSRATALVTMTSSISKDTWRLSPGVVTVTMTEASRFPPNSSRE